MATIIVSTAAQLMAAAAKVRPGDTIALEGGSYTNINLRNMDFHGVTITSVDPSKPAELTGLKAINVSGLTFTNLTFADKTPATAYDFEIKNSKDIAFDHVVIKGADGASGYDSNPFMVRSSENVSITNSEITHLRYGINMLDNTGVVVKGNYFHDIRADGIHGGGLSNIDISSNLFTNFRPQPGDHADAIQFWTANQTTSASNISVTNNVVLRGDGGPIQGIFMGDEVDTLPYKNVLISGNLIVGGLFNGIYVERADGLTVTNNSVVGYTDQASWIRVNDATVLDGNVAQVYILDGVTQAVSPKNNAITLPVYDGGSALANTWLDAHPEAQALLKGSAVLKGVYADLAQLASAPPPPVPVTTVQGTDGVDRLKAVAVGDSVLIGGNGNDSLTGGAGHTRMEGGKGDDVYYVNSDRDTVIERAGEGNDTVYTTIDYRLVDNVETLRLAATNLTVHGNDLDNRIVGSDGVDHIHGGAGNDNLMGQGGNDFLYGGDGDDTLNGGSGDDWLEGGVGADMLQGGEGDDWLFGGDGDDTLEGGVGNDVMSGGAGKDMFLFRPTDLGGYDKITDFSTAQGDRIGLSLIDAVAGTAANEAFKFVGTAGFSKTAGELHYVVKDGGVLVEGDVNGDGVADLSIFLQGVSSVTAKDFIL
ncbi:right-handed parallel beta-helix repeat-containing protein [Sphingomonas turrisvirgatae]|uniref:Right handed beta helix domain-containing protein n=1 Tax=Sphingomonas turrisvirgatae TaxID=1888892 RepID=A0A1E3LUH2_9SPHN|nr:right-handed parallel beta-helix repeat-containing protein [Sphingomonas turrisvirgatae]ODP36470.1 hypothetical protein BFL28_05635 [Sphingomonas turrisvirgatae]